MGEIRIVCPGKTPGYPYPVCKKSRVDYMLGSLVYLTVCCVHMVFELGALRPGSSEG